MAYQYLNPNAGNEFSQNANQWFNSISQDNARVYQAKAQIAAQQNAQISQAVSAIMQLGGAAFKNFGPNSPNSVNNTVMNNLQPPRAGLVAGPGDQSVQDFSAANPSVSTAGTAPFTGNQGTNAMQTLQKTEQMQKLLGQPNTPEELLRQNSARQALQNPNLFTPQQQATHNIAQDNREQSLNLARERMANEQTQRDLINKNRGTSGEAAASQAVLPYNMSTMADPNKLANAPANQLGNPSGSPVVDVNITKSGTPAKNMAETQARIGVDTAIKAITKQAGLATPMGLDGFVATSGAAVDNGNGTVKYMGVDVQRDTWDQLLGLVSSVTKPSQPMSLTGGSAPAQSGATFNRYFGQ